MPKKNSKRQFPADFSTSPNGIISITSTCVKTWQPKREKYQAKRNHINKFNKKFAYEYIPITPELVPECLQLECKWYKANREDNDEEDLNDERRSIIYALNHYDELGLIGGAICVDHQIVAFTLVPRSTIILSAST